MTAIPVRMGFPDNNALFSPQKRYRIVSQILETMTSALKRKQEPNSKNCRSARIHLENIIEDLNLQRKFHTAVLFVTHFFSTRDRQPIK